MPAALVLLSASLAAALIVLRLRWRAPIGTDEGYLWYGCQRLLAGEVPLRDFRAYEPGRYLWCAPWLRLVGRGILGVRIAVHVFHGLCVGCGLLLLSRAGVQWQVLLAVGAFAFAAALPQHKLFEPGIALLYVGAAAHVLAVQDAGSVLVLGIVLGLAASIGMNLALYTTAATLLLAALAIAAGQAPTDPALLWPLLLGGIVGAAPLLGYAVLARGFAAALYERRVRTVLGRGTSNLPLPVPWPWRAATHAVANVARSRQLGIGIVFLALPLLPLLGLAAWVLLGDKAHSSIAPALLAASGLAAFSWHHAFSRADPPHLAQSSIPAFMVAACLLQAVGLPLLGAALAPLGLWLFWPWFGRPRLTGTVLVDADGWPVRMATHQAQLLQELRNAIDALPAPHPSPLLALPTLVWLLPILRVRSPVQDTFCVYPASHAEQHAMIAELQRRQPPLAVVSLAPLDGVPARAFPHTHPEVMAWLDQHYRAWGEPIPHLRLLRKEDPHPRDTFGSFHSSTAGSPSTRNVV